MMAVRFVYKGTIVGNGTMTNIPRVGDFYEHQKLDRIFRVEAVMFKTILNEETGVIIYLVDVMSETEKKLRTY